MSPDLKAKLAQVAARIAATQERLRGMARSASSLRHDLESLRTEVEREAGGSVAPAADEWDLRVPTKPLAVGGLGGEGKGDAASGGTAGAAGSRVAAAAPDDEPWPDR
jgi:hypothetical protein